MTAALAVTVLMLVAVAAAQALAMGALLRAQSAQRRLHDVLERQVRASAVAAQAALALVSQLAAETQRLGGVVGQALAAAGVRLDAVEDAVATADRTVARVMRDAARMTKES